MSTDDKTSTSDSAADNAELLCPACGAVLTERERTEGGWNCKCGDFVPEALAINPFKGISCQHKQNRSWR